MGKTGEIGDAAGALRLIEDILADPAAHRASALHADFSDAVLAVRLRRNGVLAELLRLEGQEAGTALDGIRRIAGRGAPAAEHVRWSVATERLPHVQRFVFRLLEDGARGAALRIDGMPAAIDRIYRSALEARRGLILVAGPAGAGRTATARAGLAYIDDGSRTVATLPDEGSAAGGGKDFPRALGEALRLDPDFVLVEDLAGRAAAEALVDAAADALLLATVEAEDAVGALARLRDYRLEPFALASALRLIIAQRLVRRLCSECRKPVQAAGSVGSLLGFDAGTIVFEAGGCDSCAGSGFAGRTAVFEAVPVDGAMRRLVNAGADEAVIANQAFRESPALGSAARALVREGVIPVSEAVALSRPALRLIG